MAFNEAYRRQVALLVRTLPFVAEEPCFALKGGTAINLFVRDMPRLSVDIDLTYVPVAPREESLRDIDAAMGRIARRISRAIPPARLAESRTEQALTRILVRVDGVQTKIEVTPVIRGCVYEPAMRRVAERVEREYGFAEIPVVSFADLYAGKIVAALDRQHPRDLFDARDLLANEGVDDALRNAFIVYLLSHNRPMSEILAPTRLDFSAEYKHGFDGMTDAPVSIESLAEAREQLIAEIVGRMSHEHREFLIGFEHGEPDWALLDVEGAQELPAVQWRRQNLDRVDDDKRAELVERLTTVLRA